MLTLVLLGHTRPARSCSIAARDFSARDGGCAVPPPASWAVYAEHRRRARCGRSQSVRSIVHGQRRTVKGTMSIIYIKGNANRYNWFLVSGYLYLPYSYTHFYFF